MDLWLADDESVIARWSGGSTQDYRGDACFQLPLVSEDEQFVLPLAGTTGHTLTVTFRDNTGKVILSATRGIASHVPQLEGTPGGEVFRTLLACP